MDERGATVKCLSDEDCFFLENVMIDIRSFIQKLSHSNSKNKALLFPPVNNFRRFLIHRLVQETFPTANLTTISIGKLYGRRTVIYPCDLTLMETRDPDEPKIVDVESKKKTSDISIYRPPAVRKRENVARNSILQNKNRKNKKPDIQIYVPRAKRLSNSPCPNEIIDLVDEPESKTVEVSFENSDKRSKTTEIPCEKLKTPNKIVEVPNEKSEISDEPVEVPFEKREVLNNVVGISSEIPKTPNTSHDSDIEEVQIIEPVVHNDVAKLLINTPSSYRKPNFKNRIFSMDCSDESKIGFSSRTAKSLVKTVQLPVEVVESESHLKAKPETDSRIEINVDEVLSPKPEWGDFTFRIPESSPPQCTTKTEKKNSNKAKKLDVETCDWEELFDESGEYVDESLISELMTAIGKVSVQKAAQDYRPYQSEEERSSDGECIIEVYGFPSEFKTEDLFNIFMSFRADKGFQIVWVDDTHALAVFSSPLIADEVLNTQLPCVKTRPLKNAIAKSKMKASNYVLPPVTRPKTCVSLARRLVSGHLGMRINVTAKQREAEKKLLSDAREQKRLQAKQKVDAWEGTSGGKS